MASLYIRPKKSVPLDIVRNAYNHLSDEQHEHLWEAFMILGDAAKRIRPGGFLGLAWKEEKRG